MSDPVPFRQSLACMKLDEMGTASSQSGGAATSRDHTVAVFRSYRQPLFFFPFEARTFSLFSLTQSHNTRGHGPARFSHQQHVSAVKLPSSCFFGAHRQRCEWTPHSPPFFLLCFLFPCLVFVFVFLSKSHHLLSHGVGLPRLDATTNGVSALALALALEINTCGFREGCLEEDGRDRVRMLVVSLFPSHIGKFGRSSSLLSLCLYLKRFPIIVSSPSHKRKSQCDVFINGCPASGYAHLSSQDPAPQHDCT